MNTPNKLTVLRMILIPFFLFFLLFEMPHHYLYALIVFAVASFTDFLDGYLLQEEMELSLILENFWIQLPINYL